MDDLTHLFKDTGYELKEKIDSGGFSHVFKALKLNTQQLVAIKILAFEENLDDQQLKRRYSRFERETVLCSTLNHPNIVRLLDKGQLADGRLYAVFEYIDGLTLKQKLTQDGALTPTYAAEIMGQVLDALIHAHNKDVIHRDIKPANIMLSIEELKTHVKILDYGIGTFTKESKYLNHMTLTLTQETLGTPSYTSPEQLRGELTTPKSDLYLWGLVFIECLTGVPAVTGNNIASIFHKQFSPINIPIPPFLAGHSSAKMLRRVLQKNPANRAANAKEVYADLKSINFSSLIPQIAGENSYANTSENSDEAEITISNDENLLYTGITEKKQISVLCVNFCMSYEHIDEDSIEVLDTLLRDYKSQTIDIAQRYGGFHVGTIGTSIIFYFGYPTASENDLRLCARTALDIISSITSRINIVHKPGVTIGINTGPVTLYADTVPDGTTVDRTMEIAHQAPINTILCSQKTKSLLEMYIEFEEANSILWRGGNLYPLTGERQAQAFELSRLNRNTFEFIGREQELTSAWQFVSQTDAPKHLHIFGEAGIGKSRMVFEIREHTKSHYHLIAQCLPEYHHNGLYPILRLLRSQYSLDSSQPSEAVNILHDTLIMLLPVDEVARALTIIGVWLGLKIPGEFSSEIENSSEQKKILFVTLQALLSHSPESKPENLIIIEDIHWADKLTLEFVDHFVSNSVGDLKLITTSRFKVPDFFFKKNTCSLELKSFSKPTIVEFIKVLLQEQSISDRLCNLIANRTDGVPLFIEEIVSTLVNKKLIHRINGKLDLLKQKDSALIPMNLRDSLQQKLDNLKHSKETVQLASAIGREFSQSLLAQASSQTIEKLQFDLIELQENDLVYLQRKINNDNYIFKHALIRDAAYESIPINLKQNYHSQIAKSLEFEMAENNVEPGIISAHWAKAEEFDKAAEFGLQAAQNALTRSSADEVIDMGVNIQSWLAEAPTEESIEKRLECYRLLTSAYMEKKGWGSDEVLHYTRLSLNLLKSTKNVDQLVPHLWWQVINGIVGGRRDQLAELCGEIAQITENISSINRSALYCAQGFYYFTEGDREKAIKLLKLASSAYDPSADRIKHHKDFGFDIGVFAKATMARAYADQCRDEEAIQLAIDAVTWAKEMDHIPSIGISLMYCGLVYQHYQNTVEVQQSANELVVISEQYNLPIYRCFGQMLLDWSCKDTSQADKLLDELKEAGSRHGLGHFQSFYAENYSMSGEYKKALNKINECLDLDNSIREGNYLAFLWLKKAKILSTFKNDNKSEVQESLRKAMQIARQQSVYYVIKEVERLQSQLTLVSEK